jgi:hypothetical protein
LLEEAILCRDLRATMTQTTCLRGRGIGPQKAKGQTNRSNLPNEPGGPARAVTVNLRRTTGCVGLAVKNR